MSTLRKGLITILGRITISDAKSPEELLEIHKLHSLLTFGQHKARKKKVSVTTPRKERWIKSTSKPVSAPVTLANEEPNL